MSQKLALKPNQAQAFERLKDFIRNSSSKVFGNEKDRHSYMS